MSYMRGMLFRKKDNINYWRYFGSLCCPNVKANQMPLLTILRSFSSSIRFSNYSDESAQSYYPPNPIPNRPLRTDSARASHPSASHPSQSLRPSSSNTNSTDSKRLGASNGLPSLQKPQNDKDFLKRFPHGFDHKEEKLNSSNPVCHPKDERMHSPASEAPQALSEDADEIFNKMKETGLIPNAVAMLDEMCKDGLVQEAMKLFGLMREKGSMPEVVIYTSVAEGFCKAHKLDDAVRIFRKMQGNGIIPNAFSYSVLIRGLCQGNRLEVALEFCMEMLEAGHSPNLTTFVGLVDGLCKEKSLEEAQNMIKTARQKGFILDEKAVRDYLERRGPFLPVVWEAILGKKASHRQSLFFYFFSFCFNFCRV